MRRRIDRVVWGEGMLVCPQHLQQQDLFFEYTLQARSTWPTPHAWGISRLQIDEASVATGTFAVDAVQVILPGGTVLDLAEGDGALPPPRPIAEHFPASAAVAEVYLGIPALREGAENYAIGDGEIEPAHPRYEAWTRDVVDLTTAQAEAQVTFARPKPVILYGNESRDEYDAIKIAELVRDDTGTFALSDDFVPPCLRMGASPALVRWTQELLGMMLTKRRALVGALRQVDSSRVEFTAQDVTRYLQLGAINAHIPLIRNFAENPDWSPFSLYSVLSQLGGQLTSFSSDIVPEELPVFGHLDLRETFAELFQKLRALLQLAMKENFITVPLEARRDGMWIGVLRDPRLLECPTYVLSIEANAAEQDLANRLPQLSKIASWKQIPKIVRSAIPGAPIKAAHRPPPQIPIRPRSVYFVVDTGHEYWRQIVEDRTIAIYLPPPYDPTRAKIHLMAVPTEIFADKAGAPR